MKPGKITDFINFAITYNIAIYFTWVEVGFFDEKTFHVSITDQPDGKISTEEKARLITENYSNSIYQTVSL